MVIQRPVFLAQLCCLYVREPHSTFGFPRNMYKRKWRRSLCVCSIGCETPSAPDSQNLFPNPFLSRLAGEFSRLIVGQLADTEDDREDQSASAKNGSFVFWTEAPTDWVISNPDLLLEILDYVVHTLHDKPETIKECFVRRSKFRSADELKSWRETFLDLSTSPAH